MSQRKQKKIPHRDKNINFLKGFFFLEIFVQNFTSFYFTRINAKESRTDYHDPPPPLSIFKR